MNLHNHDQLNGSLNYSFSCEHKLQNEFINGYQYQSGIDQYWATVHQTVLNVDTNTVPFM